MVKGCSSGEGGDEKQAGNKSEDWRKLNKQLKEEAAGESKSKLR